MYMDSDDARSDFFLAAATYLIGGAILGFLLRLIAPALPSTALVAGIVSALIPFLLLWAMPLYLMRYRGEEPRSLLWGSPRSLTVAAAFGAAIAAGTLGGDLLAGNRPLDGIMGVWANPANVIGRVVEWIGIGILTTFLYRRAEYAFRTIDDDAAELHQRAAIATAGVAVIASVLLLLAGGRIGLVLAPLGFGVAYLIGVQMIPPRGLAERWQVLSPLITLALGPIGLFSIFGDSASFLADVRSAGMLAAFGLLGVMSLRAGLGPRVLLLLGVIVALASSVTVFGAAI